MAYPSKYERSFGFFDFQNVNPTRPLPGNNVDTELEDVALVTHEIVEFLKGFTRSDGKLANESVGLDQLVAGMRPDGQVAIEASEAAQAAQQAAETAQGLAEAAQAAAEAARDAAQTAQGLAEAAAGSAQGSATAAAGSAAVAEAAETAAAGSASDASGSASAASGFADDASGSASAAADSASAAALSESNAADSANAAADSAGDAGAHAGTAESWSALAQRWAEEDEDVPVAEDPDLFSAKHWAAKAATSVGSADPDFPLPYRTFEDRNDDPDAPVSGVRAYIKDGELFGRGETGDPFPLGGGGDVAAADVGVDPAVAGETNVQAALEGLEAGIEEIFADPWWFHAIEELVPLRSSNFLPPKDKGYRYVLLTAGETGSGDYNEGILVSESVSGSFPLVQATAQVNLAASPLHGQTIHLLNTEGRFLRASTSPGTVQADQFQGHWHRQRRVNNSWQSGTTSGVRDTDPPDTNFNNDGFVAEPRTMSEHGTVRFGNETRPKNIGVTYVMRVL